MSPSRPPVVSPHPSEMTPLRAWARRLFLIGNVMLALGAILHSLVHALEMMGPDLEQTIRDAGTVEVMGSSLEIWDIFQGQSMLYGVVALALALSNLASLRRHTLPNSIVSLIGVGMFAAMAAVGVLHLGPLQTVGGPVGMLMFGFTPAVLLYERLVAGRRS